MSKPQTKVLVTGGAGQLGSAVVRQLVNLQNISKVLILDRDEVQGNHLTCHAQSMRLMNQGAPQIQFIKSDLTDTAEITRIITENEPDIIIHTATLLSSYFYLPILKMVGPSKGFSDPLPGHTVPKDLALTYTLMQALKASKLPDTMVINTSFPDHVNHILGKIDLAPDIGAGNIDIIVYMIRVLLSSQFKISPEKVQVHMVAHHALENHPESTTPVYIQVLIDGKDRSDEIDYVSLIQKAVKVTLSWEKGIDLINESTATNVIKNTKIILEDRNQIEYIPGPKGLPGGYPTKLGRKTVEVVLPDNITLDEAIEINKRGMVLDGIEKINADGTIIFTKPAIALMQDLLEINWRRCSPDEAMAMSRDLRAAYHRLAETL